MDIKLNENITLTFDVERNQPVFLDGLNGSPVSSYTANAMLGQATRNPGIFQQLEQFMNTYGIPADMGVSIETADVYTTDRAAQLSVGVVSAAYPIFSQLFKDERGSDGFYGTTPLSSTRIIEACRAQTFEDFITRMFGVYRKDLARAVANSTDCSAVFWVSMFAGHVPYEWLVHELETKKFYFRTGCHTNDASMNRMLSLMDKFTVRRLMKTLRDDEYAKTLDFLEACRFLENIDEENITLPKEITPEQLHSHFLLLSNGLTVEDEFSIPETVEALDGGNVNGLRSVVLRTSNDYSLTGEVMENCAGNVSYVADSVQGLSYLVRFDEGANFRYLLEFSRKTGAWKVSQLFGPKNSEVPVEDQEAIESFIKEKVGR